MKNRRVYPERADREDRGIGPLPYDDIDGPTEAERIAIPIEPRVWWIEGEITIGSGPENQARKDAIDALMSAARNLGLIPVYKTWDEASHPSDVRKNLSQRRHRHQYDEKRVAYVDIENRIKRQPGVSFEELLQMYVPTSGWSDVKHGERNATGRLRMTLRSLMPQRVIQQYDHEAGTRRFYIRGREPGVERQFRSDELDAGRRVLEYFLMDRGFTISRVREVQPTGPFGIEAMRQVIHDIFLKVVP